MVAAEWWDKALMGDQRAIARCITLIENEDRGMHACLVSSAMPQRGKVIGITGPPGAGKSTLVDALIGHMTDKGRRVAVLCVDPSSPFSRGAILGDRVRMSRWYRHPDVYIRSLASRGSLGGLHPFILEIADFLSLCPFDDIIIETVGVGQSEVEISGLADVTVVVLVPESGDEIQAMKAGLMEIADVFVVNKCDRPDADLFVSNLQRMISSGALDRARMIPVCRTTATRGEGLEELMQTINQLREIPVSDERRIARLADRAYHLITKKRMQDIRTEDLRSEISAILSRGVFNLHAFIENF